MTHFDIPLQRHTYTVFAFLTAFVKMAWGFLLLDLLVLIVLTLGIVAGDPNIAHVSFFDAQLRFLLGV